jgi:hypothetical protein
MTNGLLDEPNSHFTRYHLKSLWDVVFSTFVILSSLGTSCFGIQLDRNHRFKPT